VQSLKKGGIEVTHLKKHAAISLLVATIVIIIALAVNTYGMKDNGILNMKDLFGSREAISDVTISGELRDGYHRTVFRMEAGHISSNTEIFKQPLWADNYRFVPGGPKRMGGLQYNVNNQISSYEITSRTDNYHIPIGTAIVTLPISYRNPAQQGDGVTYTNSPEYGLAKIGDKVYFTVPVSTYFTGTIGIYELKFSEWGFRSLFDSAANAAYAPRKIVDISLDANNSDGKSGIEILGLEAVGNQLVLLSVQNNKLLIRSYDSDNGELLGEAAIADFYLSGRPGDNRPADSEVHKESYEAYSDPENNLLNISFKRSSFTQNLMNVTMLSIDFSEVVKVVHTVKTSFDDGEEDTFSGISHMSYRKGKLYVIKTFREPESAESRIVYEITRSKHFYIYVYEHSKLVYKGELVTELNEDNIRAINLSPLHGGFGYDQMDYRYFTNVAIE
jgi:hypothetical protein